MPGTLVVVGFGPGISTAVAEKFGKEGFAVALVGRTPARLAAGVAALKTRGIAAAACPGDAGDPASIRAAIADARRALGPIGAIHWNAFSTGKVRDLLADDPAVGRIFDVAVFGLLAAVAEAEADLKAAGDGAVLVTNGAFGLPTPPIDAMATQLGAIDLALSNAAKHKLVGLLAERLRGEGVFVGEVMVAGAVKGTPTGGAGGIEADAVADRFWMLYKARGEIRATIG